MTPIVRQYIVYAMEDNVPTLRADINQLKRTQRLGHQKVSVTSIIRKGFACLFNFSTQECRRLRFDLILTFKIFKWEVDPSPPGYFLRPRCAGHALHASRFLQQPSRLRRWSYICLVGVGLYWNRFPAPQKLSTSVSTFKTRWTVSFCIISPDYQCFPELPNPDQFMWALLALVANPTINK